VTFARRPHALRRLALAPFARTRASGRAVLLTFDDGPHPEHTPAVLDRLAAFGARAAFFLVGSRVADPALVARVARAGHLLGNHTFAHAVPRWWALRTDVRACQEVVPQATLFRAPLGKLTPALWWAARREGLVCVHWALDTGDWRCRTDSDARACAREVLELVRPGDVVLLHDAHAHAGAVLDELLPGLAARGLLVDAPEG
jgi:peptidoglycan/xylan/chitin deacetylase (PgdA/CDA1 family)